MALLSCQRPSLQKDLLYGNWQGASWKVHGRESGRDFRAVTFTFNPDDTYRAAFADQVENGVYRLDGNKLYTTGENQIEKMVRLASLLADTLVMDMNRVGAAEELVLVKQK